MFNCSNRCFRRPALFLNTWISGQVTTLVEANDPFGTFDIRVNGYRFDGTIQLTTDQSGSCENVKVCFCIVTLSWMKIAIFTLKISEYSFILFFRVSVRLLRLVTLGCDMVVLFCCQRNLTTQLF